MSDDIVNELRGWEDNLHVADGRGFCETCSIRMPCDWAMAVDEMRQAADEIERLRAALERTPCYCFDGLEPSEPRCRRCLALEGAE